jgi:hypothetical protein
MIITWTQTWTLCPSIKNVALAGNVLCMFLLRNYRTNLIKRDKNEKSKKDSKKQTW